MTRLPLPHLLAAVAALTLTGCGLASPEPPPSIDPDNPSFVPPLPESPVAAPELRAIAGGLDAPWSIAFHHETPLVSERDRARIVELTANGTPREVGRIEDAAPSGEGGVLGLAVHDDRLYVYYTTAQDNRIERFDLLGSPGGLSLGQGEVILDGLPAAGNHNGGRIAFGPDDLLYVTVGDAGQREQAQQLDSLAGKILRITPDGEVPPDNPFEGSPVYSYGHRNPQGLAWDADGQLFATEFGQDTWDELNLIDAGGNYGWPEVEGAGYTEGFVDPLQQWAPSDASPSGMAQLDGTLYLANLRGERLREVPLADPTTATERYVGEFGRLRDVTVAPDGSLWMLTNNTDGRGNPRSGDDWILQIPAHQ